MAAENASATEGLLARMRIVLDELDARSYPIAAAYVSQAISVVEGQAAADRESRD